MNDQGFGAVPFRIDLTDNNDGLSGRRWATFGSWRAYQKRRREVRFLSGTRDFWGYLLARRVLWKARRHANRLRARELKLVLTRFRIEGRTVESQISVPQVPIADTPIEPMAPCALAFQ